MKKLMILAFALCASAQMFGMTREMYMQPTNPNLTTSQKGFIMGALDSAIKKVASYNQLKNDALNRGDRAKAREYIENADLFHSKETILREMLYGNKTYTDQQISKAVMNEPVNYTYDFGTGKFVRED